MTVCNVLIHSHPSDSLQRNVCQNTPDSPTYSIPRVSHLAGWSEASILETLDSIDDTLACIDDEYQWGHSVAQLAMSCIHRK